MALYLGSVDMENSFDYVDHNIYIAGLKRHGFGLDSASCVVVNAFTNGYFGNERGTRQGDPVSVYLYRLVLEILFPKWK